MAFLETRRKASLNHVWSSPEHPVTSSLPGPKALPIQLEGRHRGVQHPRPLIGVVEEQGHCPRHLVHVGEPAEGGLTLQFIEHVDG